LGVREHAKTGTGEDRKTNIETPKVSEIEVPKCMTEDTTTKIEQDKTKTPTTCHIHDMSEEDGALPPEHWKMLSDWASARDTVCLHGDFGSMIVDAKSLDANGERLGELVDLVHLGPGVGQDVEHSHASRK